MRARNTQMGYSNQEDSTVNPYPTIGYPLLKPFWLCVSSILSMAIVLATPVRAEEQLPVLRDAPDRDFELTSLLSSEPSELFENPTIASFDGSVLNGLNQENLVYSAQALQQAAPLFVEFSEENAESIESIETSFPLNFVAQDIALEPPVIVQSIEIEPTDTEPTGIAPTERELTEPSVPSTPTAQDDNSTSQPAESLSSPTPSNSWQFSAEPYFFVPLGVQADVTVDGRSTSLDLGLDDILNLDRAFNAGLRLGAQNNRWGLILDGFYLSAEESGRLGQTFSAGSLLQFVQRTAPRRLEAFIQQFDPEQLQQVAQQLGERQIGLNTPVRITASGNVAVEQVTVDAAVSYRVVDTSLDHSPEESNFYPRFMVAPILGVRTNFLRQTIEVDTIRVDNLPISDDALPRIDREFRFSRTLVEPLIGAQFGLGLSERWSLGFRGDVSGFNIGADENLTWNLLASVQYRLSRLASLQLGYRFNSFDFEDGEGFARAKLNLRQNGLWLSAMFQF